MAPGAFSVAITFMENTFFQMCLMDFMLQLRKDLLFEVYTMRRDVSIRDGFFARMLYIRAKRRYS